MAILWISFPSLKSRGHVLIILAFLLLWPGSGTQQVLNKYGVSDYIDIEKLEHELSHKHFHNFLGLAASKLDALAMLGREAVPWRRAKWILTN